MAQTAVMRRTMRAVLAATANGSSDTAAAVEPRVVIEHAQAANCGPQWTKIVTCRSERAQMQLTRAKGARRVERIGSPSKRAFLQVLGCA